MKTFKVRKKRANACSPGEKFLMKNKVKRRMLMMDSALPGLSTDEYSFTSNAVKRKKKQIENNLQSAEDAIESEVGKINNEFKHDYQNLILKILDK